jgi:hypothetical protein
MLDEPWKGRWGRQWCGWAGGWVWGQDQRHRRREAGQRTRLKGGKCLFSYVKALNVTHMFRNAMQRKSRRKTSLTLLQKLEFDCSKQQIIGSVAWDLGSKRTAGHKSKSEIFVRDIWGNIGDV